MNLRNIRAIAKRCWAAGLISLLAASPVLAADYPERPVKLIVPFTPGGLTDTGARIVAEKLGQVLGQSIVVDNRPGAGGNIGAQAVVSAPADGYTLLLGFDGTLVINPHVYAKVPFNTLKDFTPIGKIGDAAGIIVVHPAVPAKTFQELVAYSRALPGGINYGSSGVGGSSHLGAEMLNRLTGAKFMHVPYKGGGQAMADVVSGVLPMNFTAVAGAYPFVKQGQVRAIAVTAPKRVASLPDVPTIAESGVPDFSEVSWIGIMAPSKTPPAAQQKLKDALQKVLAMPDVKERLGMIGIYPSGQTPVEFGVQISKDLPRIGEVVKALDIKID